MSTQEPLSPSEGLTYLLETYSDRERLYRQFELTRDEFNTVFDRTLAFGGLETDPKEARWRVLDAGCGEGLFSEEIVTRFPRASVVGFDRDSEAVITATKAFGSMGDLSFFTHDARFPLPEAVSIETATGKKGLPITLQGFNVVVAWFVVLHIKEAKQALANLNAALNPGGVICLHDISVHWLEFPHPAVQRLIEVGYQAWSLTGAPDVAEHHREYLEAAGFRDVTTFTHTYQVGGATPQGQRWLKHVFDSYLAIRRAVVEVLKLISAEEFDDCIEQIKHGVTVDMVGKSHTITSLARK